MSDFDSNPFADPDLNNPFKVSVAPSLSRRREGSLLAKTDKFLRAHRARPSAALGRSTGAPGRGGTPFGVRARAPASLAWGSEPNVFSSASGPPSPRPRRRSVMPWPGSGPERPRAPGLLSAAARVGVRAGGVVTCQAGSAGPARPARRGREGGSELALRGVVMGTRGGAAELCLE